MVVNKSTVPVGTAARTAEMLNRLDVTVGSDRNSSAKVPQWKVFLHPDRIMVGCDAQDTTERVAAFVHSTRGTDRTHRLTDSPSSRSENQWFGYPRPCTVVGICYGL